MSLPYITLTMIATPAQLSGFESSFPILPFAYFFTVPDDEGHITVYPEAVRSVPNSGDFTAASLSATFPDCVVILAAVDADDSLRMRFFHRGDFRAGYETEPGKSRGEELPPSVRGFDAMATLFRITADVDRRELEALLRANRYDDEHGFGEAKERHGEIATLLNLPGSSVGTGYESIERGVMPDQIPVGRLRHQATNKDFQDTDVSLRQFELYCAKEEESDGQIAARFLPDVISWEDDFLDEGYPSLGAIDVVRSKFTSLQSGEGFSPYSGWMSLSLGSMESLAMDLGCDWVEGAVEHITMFSLSKEVPTAEFARLCEGTSWSVWSHDTRRTVIGSAASSV